MAYGMPCHLCTCTENSSDRLTHRSLSSIKQPPPLFSPAIDFSAGTKEDWREDADDFPEVALGEPLGDWQGEVWVDINNEVWMDDVVHLVLFLEQPISSGRHPASCGPRK